MGGSRALCPRVVLSHALLQDGRNLDTAEQALRDVMALEGGNVDVRNSLAVFLRNRWFAAGDRVFSRDSIEPPAGPEVTPDPFVVDVESKLPDTAGGGVDSPDGETMEPQGLASIGTGNKQNWPLQTSLGCFFTPVVRRQSSDPFRSKRGKYFGRQHDHPEQANRRPWVSFCEIYGKG